jgi:hypothetical protein
MCESYYKGGVSGGGGDGAQNKERGERGEEAKRVVREAGGLWTRLRTWICALSLFGLLPFFLPVAAASVGSCVKRWVASCNTHKPSFPLLFPQIIYLHPKLLFNAIHPHKNARGM